MGGGGSGTAIVVDQWPLVRHGLTRVLAAGGVDVVGHAAKVSESLLLVRMSGVDLIVFGSPLDGLSPAAIRSAKRGENAPKVVVLIPPDSTSGAVISLYFAAGADALLVASVGAEELADALARVRRGERVVGPELGPERPGRAGSVGPERPGRAGSVGPERPGAAGKPGPEQPSGRGTEGPEGAATGQNIGAGRAAAGEPPLLSDEGASLTAKELEVLALLAQGHSNKQIARALYVSDATVKTHLQHIYAKLEVRNRFGALSRAAELGLLK